MSKTRDFRLDLSRRHALKAFGGAAFFGLAMTMPTRLIAHPVFTQYPFQLGVASGDPAPDGFVIWTRLAPEPFERNYGMPMEAVEVGYQVATDRRFQDIVAQGTAIARPELGHSVHVELAGLPADRDYFYRFRAGSERSLVGRARTTPAFGAPTSALRFGIAGCQAYEQGFYTAYRHLAEENPDFIYCYGDYIYEYRGRRIWNGPDGPIENVRMSNGSEIYTIADYRRRYAECKMDADLQAAHAAAPWVSVWDDHEIDNNWVGHEDQDGTPAPAFKLRQQMAMQAYYENMPLRASSLPVGPAMQIFRRMPWGDLADVHLLDTRQFRSDQPCGDRFPAGCDEINRRDVDILGERQLGWLLDNMSSSPSTWQVAAQQIMVMDLDRRPSEPGLQVNPDSWGGYRVPRRAFLDQLASRGLDSTIVLTGDEHQHYAGNLYRDGQTLEGGIVATEFVTTSISSSGNGEPQRRDMVEIQAANEQLIFNNSQRGYSICEVTKDNWVTHHRVLDRVTERGFPIKTAASFAVEPGRPGVQSA